MKICLDAIDHTTPHSEFSKLGRKSVQLILETEYMSLPEETLYELVMSWTDEQCRMHGLPVHDLNRRKVLNELVNKIRFPAMDLKYFAENIASRDILTDREKVVIFQSMSTGKDQTSPEFIYRRRRPRFKKREIIENQDNSLNTSLPLSFQTSAAVLLLGVTIPHDNSSRFKHANLSLNAQLSLLRKTKTVCVRQVLPSSYSPHEYLLDPPIYLLPNQSYSLTLTIMQDDDNRLTTTKSSATFIKFNDTSPSGSCKIAGLVIAETYEGGSPTVAPDKTKQDRATVVLPVEKPKLERSQSSNSAFYWI